mgnify:FL=1
MAEITKKHSTLISYIIIVIGTGLLGVGIQNFYDPIGLVTGGFTGLTIIIKAVTTGIVEGGIPLWVSNLVLNIPVFILAYIFKGKKFVGRTIFGTVMLSVWLYILPANDFSQGDYLLAAIFGAVFSGCGLGIILRGNATTGGTEMVAVLLQLKIKHLNAAQIMQFLDGAIVVAGMFQFGIRPTMYAIIAVFVTTKVSDVILEGSKWSKAAYIISDRYEEIADKLMKELDRGVTAFNAKGMYTREDKSVLYCVVSKREIPHLKEIVEAEDRDAFVIVEDVREVLGEGFQEYNKA